LNRPPVVVMGLDCPTGLQTARVFAARGIEVIGIAADPNHPCARTRSCRRVIRAESDSESMVEALIALASQLEARAVLVPCTDRAVLGVARHRQRLSEHFLSSVPPLPVIEQLMDKARFAAFAVKHDLPIPLTHVLRCRGDVETAAREMRFPCVFKPSIKSVLWDDNVSAKALVARSPDELLDLFHRHGRWADAFVVQEWIDGGDTDHYTCDCYLADGEALVTFSSRKLRQWPPVVGQACLSVEHRNDAVPEEAIRVFRNAGHQGQGYIELKWDHRTGRHLIIEANVGRPTGRSTAAEKAGVELLMTMYCHLIGDPLPAERVQHFQGLKWIYIRRDLQACAYMLFHRRTTLGAIVRSWRGPFAFALFSLRDPVPFLADLTRAVRGALTARRRSRPGRVTPLSRRDRFGDRAPTSDMNAAPAPEPSAGRVHPFVSLAIAGAGSMALGHLARSLAPLLGG